MRRRAQAILDALITIIGYLPGLTRYLLGRILTTEKIANQRRLQNDHHG